MSVQTAPVDTPSVLRLQLTAEADPTAIFRVLESLVILNVMPERLFATLTHAGTLRIELDTAALLPQRAELIASRLHQVLRVLTANWHQVSANAKRKKGIARHTAGLSERERQVVRELSDGKSNKLIARRLALSAPTVNFHVRNVYRKLGVRKRASAVAEALRRGWLD